METLYSGLDRDDVAAIGAALREAGVPFDVNAESTVVLVPAGQASTARMILAEKGLPRSGAVGNELFDKLGSLGLTSFMQDVTRLRALEGELARTIQMMRSVKAARVHIVLADEGSFRRERQPPSASVVIRTDGGDDRATGQAIRHLVASAVPGMKVDDVTVLNVDGRLLASGTDSIDKSPDNLLALEKEMSQEVRESVARTLTPYLSARNFQISVAARLNADRTQTSETIYNPDQRVERSVRVTKEQQSSQNAAGTQAAGSPRTCRRPTASAAEQKQSNDQTQKREELTNYEVSSKSIQTTSAGFVIQQPVRRRPDQSGGADRFARRQGLARGDRRPGQGDRATRRLRRRPRQAARRRRENFRRGFRRLEPRPRAGARSFAGRDRRAPDWLDRERRRDRPRRGDDGLVRPASGAEDALGGARREGRLGARRHRRRRPCAGRARTQSEVPHRGESGRDEFLEALIARRDNGPERKLLKLVEFDENQAVTILKQWIRQGANG